MRRNRKHIHLRVLALLAGLALVLCCIEIGLRVVGRVHVSRALSDKRTRSRTDGNAFIVLCVGDSFTYGSGASAGQDYPAQLENLLCAKYPDRKIIVVNRGIGCANTRVVLDSLENNLRLVEPDVVIALAGIANLWNFYGLDSFVQGRDTVGGKLRNLLYRLRLFKLCKLLYLDLTQNSRPQTQSAFYPVSAKDADDPKYHVRTNHKTTPVEGSPEYYAWKGLEEYHAGRTEKAIDWFVRATQEHPRDPESYTWLNECLVRVGRGQEAIDRLNIALKTVKPPLPVLYSELSRAYFEDGRFDLSARTALDGAKVFPFSRGIFDAFINAFKCVKNESRKTQLLSMLKNIADGPDGKLAGEFFVYAGKIKDNAIEEILPLWIETGLKKIVSVCNGQKTPVVLATYPHDSYLSPVIKRAASAQGTELVDFYHIFSLIDPAEHDGYFSVDGHCNGKGYFLMAEEFVRVLGSRIEEGGQ